MSREGTERCTCGSYPHKPWCERPQPKAQTEIATDELCEGIRAQLVEMSDSARPWTRVDTLRSILTRISSDQEIKRALVEVLTKAHADLHGGLYCQPNECEIAAVIELAKGNRG